MAQSDQSARGEAARLSSPQSSALRDRYRTVRAASEALTRSLFNHTEHGLNVPGVRLGEARVAYETEINPAKRRVKGAMLAGALFNRANDIFRRLVDLQTDGVEISSEYPLVQECGRCLVEALELGRVSKSAQVRLHSFSRMNATLALNRFLAGDLDAARAALAAGDRVHEDGEDPSAVTSGAPRAVRGGSYRSPPEGARSAARCQLPAGARLRDVGFRVARTRPR